MAGDYDVDHWIRDEDDHVHKTWNNDREPIRIVESGDVVRFECRDANDGAITEETTPEDLAEQEFEGHALTGPVAVEGVEPSDVLQVDVLEVDHHGWGYTLYRPGERGLGLLPEDFPEGGLHVWDFDGDVGHFVNGIEIPLAPFPGVVGVAPAADGDHDTAPPRSVGGNLDVKHLVEGSTLYLPVAVEDALFSIGDGHAAQGDGEVCISAIEAPLTVTVRLTRRSDLDVQRPQFRTNGPYVQTNVADERTYGTTGVSDDLMVATKQAVRGMIDHIHENYGLTRGEAYLLCSAAIDVKINEVVNPNYVVSAYVPERIFPD